MIRRVNAEFVPVALKMGMVNGMPGANGDDDESRLCRAIGRSKLVQQGICVVNPWGKVLDWAVHFDDDKSVTGFLDRALERYKEHPDASSPFAAERFGRFPSQRVPDVADDGATLAVPDGHPAGTFCPAKPPMPRGTLVARLTGRTLEKDGQLTAETKSQERYVEEVFQIFPAQQDAFVKAIEAASGDSTVKLPHEVAYDIVGHAYLGPFGMPVLRRCELRARRVGEGGSKIRIEGETDVVGSTDGRDGTVYEHEVKLSWEGYAELSERRITRLLLAARGHEKLSWRDPGTKAGGSDVSHLAAGRPFDVDAEVRYGIKGEPAPASETSDDARAPLAGIEGLRPSIREKMARLEHGLQQWQANGRDPSPIVHRVHEELGPLMMAGKIDEAEAVLDRALAALGGEKNETLSVDDEKVRQKLRAVVESIQRLGREGKLKEAEAILDKLLDSLGGAREKPGNPATPDGAPKLEQKMQKLREGLERWQRDGRDPSPVGKIMDGFAPLMKEGRRAEAEAVLDRALALLAEPAK